MILFGVGYNKFFDTFINSTTTFNLVEHCYFSNYENWTFWIACPFTSSVITITIVGSMILVGYVVFRITMRIHMWIMYMKKDIGETYEKHKKDIANV